MDSFKIVVGSTSGPKISAVEGVIKEFFGNQEVQIISHDVDSKVSPTPFSIDECILGARNRIEECKKNDKDGKYYIGIESGIIKTSEFFLLGAWAVIQEGSTEKEGVGSSAMVPLPREIFSELSPDVRISDTMDYSKFDQSLIDQKKVLGVGGVITKGVIKRHDQVSLALRVAFSILKDK